MESKAGKILDFLSNKDVTFFIPPYQRNYEWKTDMCEILYNDIVRVSAKTSTEHFFGTIIFHVEKVGTFEPDTNILVDGQQRLTTIMLFLIAVRDAISDSKYKKTIEYKFLKNESVTSETEYKIKLKQVESDWEVFRKIILKENLSEEDKKTCVYINYDYFFCKLKNLDDGKIINLVQQGLLNFNIVTIQLEPDRNRWEKPQEIFESMNSLGAPLTLADLTRNYLLMGKSAAEQKRLYRDYWMQIEKNLTGEDKSFSVSSFIRDYMQLIATTSCKKATEINSKELYRVFKSNFEQENHTELLAELATLSHEYSVLAGYESSGNRAIDRKISDLKVLEFSGYYTFILCLLNFRRMNKISDDSTIAVLDAIFTYIARRRILRITQGENKNAPILIRSFDAILTAEDKKQKMFELFAQQPYALRLPNDDEIKGYLSSKESNLYNLKAIKFLLSLIEEKLTRSRPDQSDKLLQVEHIMPQELSQEWKKELGEKHEQIHNDYLNNIGNLTLIRHNQILGNKSFFKKSKVYNDSAGLQIARDKIVKEITWGEKEIQARAEYITDILLCKIFPLSNSFKQSQNYSVKAKSQSSRALSFDKLKLVGQTIAYYDDQTIKAEVLSDKQVKFENNVYRLSPLTREIESRKNRLNKSGAYWGAPQWKHGDKTLEQLIEEMIDEIDHDFEDAEDKEQ